MLRASHAPQPKRVADRALRSLVTVSTNILPAIPNPSDAVLATYVKAHPEKFSTPEYRDVEFAQIAPQDLAGGIAITDTTRAHAAEMLGASKLKASSTSAAGSSVGGNGRKSRGRGR